MTGQRVLLIDPEPANRRLLRTLLVDRGLQVDAAASGQEALDRAVLAPPELILLDLDLRDMDGLDLCQALRAWTAVPIIIVSRHADERTKVEALDRGADDYLTRPFGPNEFLARLRAVLRRVKPDPAPAALQIGGLRLDQVNRRVTVRAAELHLTPTEYALLRYLMTHAGRVVTYPTLVTAVWGHGYTEGQATLRVHIGQLRRKIEPDPARPTYIHTHARVGYRFRGP
jgi:two-component system KDP operon response regulator KdpE